MSELDYIGLSTIFAKYYKRLTLYCVGYLGSYMEAEDTVQDCFVRLWEKRNSLNAVSVEALLFTMVRNSCLNALKHKAIVAKFQITPPIWLKGFGRVSRDSVQCRLSRSNAARDSL